MRIEKGCNLNSYPIRASSLTITTLMRLMNTWSGISPALGSYNLTQLLSISRLRLDVLQGATLFVLVFREGFEPNYLPIMSRMLLPVKLTEHSGDTGRTRTYNLRSRNPFLYPIEIQCQIQYIYFTIILQYCQTLSNEGQYLE